MSQKTCYHNQIDSTLNTTIQILPNFANPSLIVQNLLCLWKRHASCQKFDHISGLVATSNQHANLEELHTAAHGAHHVHCVALSMIYGSQVFLVVFTVMDPSTRLSSPTNSCLDGRNATIIGNARKMHRNTTFANQTLCQQSLHIWPDLPGGSKILKTKFGMTRNSQDARIMIQSNPKTLVLVRHN